MQLFQICLFDDFKSIEYANAKNLVSGVSFKKFVDDVLVLIYFNLSMHNVLIINPKLIFESLYL